MISENFSKFVTGSLIKLDGGQTKVYSLLWLKKLFGDNLYVKNKPITTYPQILNI